MILPKALIDSIESGKAILVLGAGASLGARDRAGGRPPTGNELKKLLADKFLGDGYDSEDLALVGAYAVSQSDLFTVQSYIKSIFEVFEPSPAHLALAKFRWAGLATTNYDLLVEQAYTQATDPLQRLAVRIENGDKVLEQLQLPDTILYLKVHGCLTRINNADCPLILTRDQYGSYRKGRDRIFANLHDWAYEHTIIYIGHGGADPDLNQTIYELELPTVARPRHYLIKPSNKDAEKKYWEEKRVTLLDGTFDDFIHALSSSINPAFAKIRIAPAVSHPIISRFVVSKATLSPATSEYLKVHVDYVKALPTGTKIDPADFYRGFNGDWSAIEQQLDISRSVVDAILEEAFLLDDLRAKKPLQAIALKGHAGSGKTIAMRRIAWTAAHEYDCLCLYLKDESPIDVSAIREIVLNTRERVFLFVDNAPDRAADIRRLLKDAGDAAELLTIILGARYNEWNTTSGDLQGSLTGAYEIGFLTKKEISGLLTLLEKHGALGRLKDKSPEERIHAFEELAGRQLLVALHEATLGKLFEEILVDEYESLVPIEAQRVYLTICLLNRLEVSVRAGLISRIHNIPFSYFTSHLFAPLEHVVYAALEPKIRDYAYKARHPIIAEIVFDRILRNEKDRFEEYYRTISALNIDYSTDEAAFVKLVKGRTLLKLFSNQQYAQDILDLAQEIAGSDHRILHQRALYEMNKPSPNFQKASALLNEASKIAPYYRPLLHTKAELALKRSDGARGNLEREKFLSEAASLAKKSRDDRSSQTHAHHTLAKINIKRLEAEIVAGEKDFSSPAMHALIKEIENEIGAGLQCNPGDSYLLTERAKLAKILSDAPRMIASLEAAFDHNRKLSYLAIQLADCYLAGGENEKAKAVLEAALDANRTDKALNYRYGIYLLEVDRNFAQAAYFFRKSFTPGDKSYSAHLYHLEALFLSGDYEATRKEIETLRSLKWSPFVENSSIFSPEQRFTGRVSAVKHGYVFAIEDRSQLSIMIPSAEFEPSPIAVGNRVDFRIAFGFKGLKGTFCKVLN